MLEIHKDIKDKLNNFVKIQKVPNIIFYGPQGTGKKTIVEEFLNNIYDETTKNKHVLYANCGNNTGIKFIRDELKFFSKSNINNKDGTCFKSIILFNADKLTNDAQSALRRCIEVNSHHTRFFIVVENREKLLKPILSRFCSIYIPYPIIQNKRQNLYTYKLQMMFSQKTASKKHILQKKLAATKPYTLEKCKNLAVELYEKGFCYLDLFQYLENDKNIDEENKYKLLCFFDKIRIEFRNEKLLLLNILYFYLLRPNERLENVSFI